MQKVLTTSSMNAKVYYEIRTWWRLIYSKPTNGNWDTKYIITYGLIVNFYSLNFFSLVSIVYVGFFVRYVPSQELYISSSFLGRSNSYIGHVYFIYNFFKLLYFDLMASIFNKVCYFVHFSFYAFFILDDFKI